MYCFIPLCKSCNENKIPTCLIKFSIIFFFFLRGAYFPFFLVGGGGAYFPVKVADSFHINFLFKALSDQTNLNESYTI